MTTPAEASEAISRLLRDRPERIEGLLSKHGAIIEAKAAVLTPVDTGMLRRANEFHVSRMEAYGQDEVSLTIANRMIYAHYQHENVMRHNQPRARDHFISIPFEKELPGIIDDIITADMREATQ